MRILVSTPDVNEKFSAQLLKGLAGSRCSVVASPRAVGNNFSEWYAAGCASALAKMDVFVAVVSSAWGCSTWMAHEADVAHHCARYVQLRCASWNPSRRAVPLGLTQYVVDTLPARPDEAISDVIGSPFRRGVVVVDKVLIYITSARGILILTQPEAASAGRQVPGGTVEPGEAVSEAALREATEETGLRNFSSARYLGSHFYVPRDWPRQIHHRHFFHIEHPSTSEKEWHHWEERPSTGGASILFKLAWTPISEAELDWQMDKCLSHLSVVAG